jgi:hypothetical protein
MKAETKTMDSHPPDRSDPYAPRWNSTATVCCMNCGESYCENEIWWQPEATLWVCKNWPKCDGAGLGFRIFHHNENCPVHSKRVA